MFPVDIFLVTLHHILQITLYTVIFYYKHQCPDIALAVCTWVIWNFSECPRVLMYVEYGLFTLLVFGVW